MRNALPHVPKGERKMLALLIRSAFAQDSEIEARRQWRIVADAVTRTLLQAR